MKSGKNVERQKIASECELKAQKSTKPCRTCRKNEHHGGHCLDDPRVHPKPYSTLPENQVPFKGNNHHALRKNDNKTEIIGVQESASVKETKTSRLRSINRLPLSNSSSPLSKSPKAPTKPIEKRSFSKPLNLLDYKTIDKSISRKSYLNRSHTSEAVHDSTCYFRESNAQRQCIKTSDLKSVKKNEEKYESRLSSPSCEGSSISDCGTSRFSKDKFDSPNKFVESARKYFLDPSAEEQIKSKGLSNSYLLKNSKKVKSEPKYPTDYSQKKLCGHRVQAREKSRNLDVVANAENLTASTLKIITRLDEMNSKSRLTKNILSNSNDKKVPKNVLRLNSAISGTCGNCQSNGSSKNSSTSKNIKILRLKTLHDFQKDLIASQRSENLQRLKNDKSKPSILKHKCDCQNSQMLDSEKSKPTSILKKKPFAQDEVHSTSLPVTFSPSVVNKEVDAQIYGILKKRLSLDENEVLRRRSYSPEVSISDCKSILKNQRRFSMVELSKRSESPDSTVQGILKQKLSKSESAEEFVETPGILKKNINSSLGAFDATPNNLNIKIYENQAAEFVRPILKKKNFSDDHNSSDTNASEIPKSILKKKLNAEPDQVEEMPKKPILKSCRVSSLEELEVKHSSNLNFSVGDSESVKPILKKEYSRYNSDEESRSEAVNRMSEQRLRQERPFSSPDIEEKLSSFLLKKQSLQFKLSTGNLDLEASETSPKENLTKNSLNKSFYGAINKSNNMENNIKLENVKNGEQIASSSSPPKSSVRQRPESPIRIPYSEPLESRTLKLRENINDKESDFIRALTNEENNFHKNSVSSGKCSNLISDISNSDKAMEVTSVETTTSKANSIGHSESASPRCKTFENNFAAKSRDDSVGELEPKSAQENDPNTKSSSVGSCGTLMAGLESKDSFDIKKKNVGNRVNSEVRQKRQTEATAQLGETESAAYFKGLIKNVNTKLERYRTQPVSAEDVKLALDKRKIVAEDNLHGEEKNYEDELSKMSYGDRVSMFETKFVLQDLGLSAKKRGTRFKTQPVTATEVESAKNKNLSTACQILSKDRDSHSNSGNKEEDASNTILKGISSKDIFSSTKVNEDVYKARISNLVPSYGNSKKQVKDLSGAKAELLSELKGMLKGPSRERMSGDSRNTNPHFCNGPPEKKLGSSSSGRDSLAERNLDGHKKPKEKGEGFEHLRNDGKLRLISKSRSNSSMAKSQSHFSVAEIFRSASQIKGDGSADENDKISCINRGLQKSFTQDLSVSEKSMEDDMSGGTIKERLERLKKSGEMDWQKRKSHTVGIEKEISILGKGNRLLQETDLRRRERSCSPNDNAQNEDEQSKISSILADRLGKLDAAKEDWKKRIKPPDALQFTAEGKKLEQSDYLSTMALPKSPSKTPLFERKKRCPKAIKFKSKKNFALSLNSVPNSPLENVDNPIVRSLSAPDDGQTGLLNLSKTEDFKKISVRVPKTDDETFTAFFKNISTVSQEHLEINDEDLDVIAEMKSSQLLIHKRNIKTQKRRVTVNNPLRALAARLPSQEYVEIKTGVVGKELKKVKTGKVSFPKNSNLAIETLAALASQEDFTAINLKKASEGSFNSQDPPYKNLMLLQVKGRRHVQTRLIEPLASNINAGDCFVLVTPKNVYHYIGEFANVIEMSRSAEISLYIQQKGDLGCTTDSVITLGKNGKATADQVQGFWELLNGNPDCEKGAGNPDEDEVFESSLNDTNKIYEVVGDELVPNERFWGCSPKIEILDPNKILVFDFGSELYVWNGKNVNLEKRKFAMKLAKEFWEEGFDYRDCDLCPLVAATYVGDQNSCFQIPESAKVNTARPPWSLFAKITQNMETVLFKEKFQDWPDYSRVAYKSKNSRENTSKGEGGTEEPKSCDAKMMIENELPEQDLVLEGSHLGRGLSYFDEETKRCSKITTHNIKVWHISDYEHSVVPNESIGQFYMEDSYIVRWHYVITSTGRELNGQPSKHLTTGRDRYAYFFWQGRDSHINDKGAAACLTVELDKENGPQIRVDQGLEPPAFLNLFQGRMVVHQGKYMSKVCKKWRLYICRGEAVTEGILTEVHCSMRHLRSAASFVLINNEKNLIIVWHGWKTLEHTRKVAASAAEFIRSSNTKDFGFLSDDIAVREETEGCETDDFLQAVGGNNRQLYFSLLEEKDHVSQTPRLFHFTSLYGNFIFTEIASPYLNKGLTTPFPFLQSDLYSASQPALFLMDTSAGLWLWQGWWSADSKNDGAGGNIRFQAERRAALTTAMSYWKLKYGTRPVEAYLIWAGLEPLPFTNQFPFWTDRDDIADINLKEGKKFGEMVSVEEELASLTQSTYSLSQLQNRPLPDGVNPTSLEDYLQPQCFQELFGVEREEFFRMPSWKKKKFKQEAGLF